MLSVTEEDEKGWQGTYSDLADVWRTERFFAWLVVIRAKGFQAKGEEENKNNSAGVQMKVRAPRFVAWFVAWSMIDEWLEFDESNSAGDQMKIPRFVRGKILLITCQYSQSPTVTMVDEESRRGRRICLEYLGYLRRYTNTPPRFHVA